MKKLMGIVFFLVVTVGLITGCSDKQSSSKDLGASDAKVVTKDTVVATINNEDITKEDLDYELFRIRLSLKLGGNDTTKVTKSSAVNELIRLAAIEKLADDKGIAINEESKQERVEKLKESLESSAVFKEEIAKVDKEQFWERETARYDIILKSEHLIDLLAADEAKEHPTFDERALKHEALQTLDELIEQTAPDLNISINDENLAAS